MKITELAQRASQLAKRHPNYRTGGQGITGQLAMVHTSIALAEADVRAHVRNEDDRSQPTGPSAHIADAAIRILAVAADNRLDIEAAINRRLHPGGRRQHLMTGEAATQVHNQEMGDMDAATYAELCWDGHQILAQAGRELAQRVMTLEASGVAPAEMPQQDRDQMAALLARPYTWAMAMTHQDGLALQNVIHRILQFEEAHAL